jgi:hypothetical protein
MLEENTNEIIEALGKDLQKVGVYVLGDDGMKFSAVVYFVKIYVICCRANRKHFYLRSVSWLMKQRMLFFI